jgi:hypothetical protein
MSLHRLTGLRLFPFIPECGHQGSGEIPHPGLSQNDLSLLADVLQGIPFHFPPCFGLSPNVSMIESVKSRLFSPSTTKGKATATGELVTSRAGEVVVVVGSFDGSLMSFWVRRGAGEETRSGRTP